MRPKGIDFSFFYLPFLLFLFSRILLRLPVLRNSFFITLASFISLPITFNGAFNLAPPVPLQTYFPLDFRRADAYIVDFFPEIVFPSLFPSHFAEMHRKPRVTGKVVKKIRG